MSRPPALRWLHDRRDVPGRGAASTRRKLARGRRAPGGPGQGDVPPCRPRGGGGAALRGGPRPGRAARLSGSAARRRTAGGPGLLRGRWTPPRPSGARAGRRGPRPGLGLRDGRLLRGGARGRGGAGRRGGHDRRAGGEGLAAPRPRRHLPGRARRGPHRGAPLRRRELRRGHLQRRDQPGPRQGTRLRRGRPRPPPRGRLAIADIVSGRALKERTRRNVELWAACIAGAIPRDSYLEAIESAGFTVRQVRRNDYRFISERALDACSTYEVESISLGAVAAG